MLPVVVVAVAVVVVVAVHCKKYYGILNKRIFFTLHFCLFLEILTKIIIFANKQNY
jgi:hypothetical protein